MYVRAEHPKHLIASTSYSVLGTPYRLAGLEQTANWNLARRGETGRRGEEGPDWLRIDRPAVDGGQGYEHLDEVAPIATGW